MVWKFLRRLNIDKILPKLLSDVIRLYRFSSKFHKRLGNSIRNVCPISDRVIQVQINEL